MEPLPLALPPVHGADHPGRAAALHLRASGPSAPPRIAVLFLLPDCNMGCLYCASELGFDTLEPATAAALLQGLRRAGVVEVVLGGGEPFLWPHGAARLAATAAGLGFAVQVATNGIDLPDGWATLAGVSRYILPLDARDPVEHDHLRRGAGSHHALVLARLTELAAAGREVTLSTVVTGDTAAGLPALARFLADRHASGGRIHSWHLYRFVPTGRGGRPNARRLAIAPEPFATAVAAVRALAPPFPVYGRSDLYAARTVEYFWSERGELWTSRGPLAGLDWWPEEAAAATTPGEAGGAA